MLFLFFLFFFIIIVFYCFLSFFLSLSFFLFLLINPFNTIYFHIIFNFNSYIFPYIHNHGEFLEKVCGFFLYKFCWGFAVSYLICFFFNKFLILLLFLFYIEYQIHKSSVFAFMGTKLLFKYIFFLFCFLFNNILSLNRYYN